MTYPTHLMPTTVVGSYPQPDWLVNRGCPGEARRAAHPCAGHLAHSSGAARAGAGRRNHSRDPRHGARRHRHHHRRRDPPRELFQPLRAGARRHRRRTSRRGAVADRRAPRRCRGSSARSAGAARSSCATSSSCCAQTDARRRSRCRVRSLCRSRRRTSSIADEEEMAMDYAAAVNEELRDLKASGVDVVQLDEPWVRTAPDKAERYGVRAINRALEGIAGPTVVHLCFGYAHVVREQAEWLRVPAAARRHGRTADLDRGGAAAGSISACWPICRASRSCWACSTWAAPTVETAETGCRAHPRRAAACRGGTADPGPGLRHEVSAARARIREVARAGRRRRDRAARTQRAECRPSSAGPAQGPRGSRVPATSATQR